MQKTLNILVTGASAGIGAAVARRLADDGHRVFGTTRNLAAMAEAIGGESAPGEPSSGRCSKARAPIRYLELDVTDRASVERCVEQVISEAGRIDVLINNAGWGVYGPVEEVSIDQAEKIFDTIYFGALRMIQAVAPSMRERGSGVIVSVSSVAGRVVLPFQVHYSAAKAALEALTLGVRQEMKPFGVIAIVVEPSDIRTRFFDRTVFAEKQESPYRPWSGLVWQYAGEVIAKAPPPEVVARTISRILRKRNPAPIYGSGIFMQRIAPTVFRFVPKRAELRLMRMFYGLGLK